MSPLEKTDVYALLIVYVSGYLCMLCFRNRSESLQKFPLLTCPKISYVNKNKTS